MMDEGGGVKKEGERLNVKDKVCRRRGVVMSKVQIWIRIRIHNKYYGSRSGKMMRILWIRILIRNTASKNIFWQMNTTTAEYVLTLLRSIYQEFHRQRKREYYKQSWAPDNFLALRQRQRDNVI